MERVAPNAFFAHEDASSVERLALKALIAHPAPVSEYPARLHHRTPGWVKGGELFHIRIRADPSQQPSLTHAELGRALLQEAQRFQRTGSWWCELFLVMPDHVHAIAAFPVSPGMSCAIRNWKRGTARLQHVRWQENYFDHRLRDESESAEIWRYIRRNPVVKGLCAREDEWPWWCAPALERGANQA